MEFSVLRPWAVVFVLPAILFCFFRLRAVKAWLGIIDAHLLKSLLVRVYVHFKQGLKIGLMGLVCLSVLCALAGVSITGRPGNLYFPKSPAVIVLDMSLSMKVRDIAPNRFSQAIFKTYDVLDALTGIPTALVVFTDEPYQLVPTTTEKEAVKALLPLLNFDLMPSRGSRLDRALQEALRTIRESGAAFGDIFLITDGADDVLELQDKTTNLIRSAAKEGNRLFVLGIGTPEGDTLFEKEDKPILDTLGNPVVHRLKEAWLRRLAENGKGVYVRAGTDGSDVAALMRAHKMRLEAGEKSSLTDERSVPDEGYWFLILPLLAFPFLFRRGRLLGILFFLTFHSEVLAADFVELFLSPSAAAMRFLNTGNQMKALKIAEDSDDFITLYNVGTKLIFLQNYPKAQELLERAVRLRPDDENAQINLEIARRLNQPPPAETPESNSNNKAQNPDNSGGQKGNAEGKNDLNQDNNNTGQHTDNKENHSDAPPSGSDENPPQIPPGDSGKGTGQSDGTDNSAVGGEEKQSPSSPDEGKGENKQPPPESTEEPSDQDDDSTENPDGQGQNNRQKDPDDMIPVHEDPLTLLRHKILFLYREKRYADEKHIGTQW